jgi:hypothetical protein
LVAISGAAQAEPEVWLNPGVYSIHFDRDKDLREFNVGFGVELVMAPEHAASVGTYINSNDERTRYIAYGWRPLQWEWRGLRIAAGAAIGAFDGYPNYRDGGWFVAPLPLLAVEGERLGANFTLVPEISGRVDGAFAIQVKLRVW